MIGQDVEILLVKDNLDDVELTLHALHQERLANHIEEARDGEEAPDFLVCRGPYAQRSFEQAPREVLLDLKLPKVEGMEVLRGIKKDIHTKAIPVVILTASREESDMVDGYLLGANGYVQKPVDFDNFRNIVKQQGLYWLVVNEPPPAVAFQAK
ncbi:MAG: response regulator [Terriglobia bacterium]|jgi:CheY-like chemotaxis protein